MSGKYFWKIGCPLPLLDRHSQTKHTIVEDYIRRYILTLMAPAHIPELKLSIIDGFCGGGCYQTEDGQLAQGSPILSMQAVRDARAELNVGRRTLRNIDVEYTFVDLEKDTTDYLNYWINGKLDEKSIDVIDYEKIRVINGNFFNHLPQIIQRIKNRKMGEHALFLLDQYSYKDIPIPQIKHILNEVKGAEVIMTFNVDNLSTYLSDRAANRKPIENIGLNQYVPWDKLKHIKAEEKQLWRRSLQRYIAHGIKSESGAKFMTLFFVKPAGLNSWGYWLIHLSNQYRAHDVMKELHWQHATEFGHELEPGIFVLGYNANKDEEYTGQNTLSFGDKHSKEACVNGVHEHFGRKVFELNHPTRLGDLFKSCITNSMAAEMHLMEATVQLHGSKNIIIVSNDGKIKRINKAYSLSDMIEPSKQISLI